MSQCTESGKNLQILHSNVELVRNDEATQYIRVFSANTWNRATTGKELLSKQYPSCPRLPNHPSPRNFRMSSSKNSSTEVAKPLFYMEVWHPMRITAFCFKSCILQQSWKHNMKITMDPSKLLGRCPKIEPRPQIWQNKIKDKNSLDLHKLIVGYLSLWKSRRSPHNSCDS